MSQQQGALLETQKHSSLSSLRWRQFVRGVEASDPDLPPACGRLPGRCSAASALARTCWRFMAQLPSLIGP